MVELNENEVEVNDVPKDDVVYAELVESEPKMGKVKEFVSKHKKAVIAVAAGAVFVAGVVVKVVFFPSDEIDFTDDADNGFEEGPVE